MYSYNQPKKIHFMPVENSEYRGGNAFIGSGRAHATFDAHGSLPGVVNSSSKVFASITEIKIVDGQVVPWLGAANMWTLNVVPFDNGDIYIRSYIQWSEDLDFQISIVVF
ncbi:hypothetical protein [Neobacillus sp. 114]|uniref:hypothetical protein n=1 Tax=Neobacillus sp. 114 TaxID=3048535 RepID=UPI001C2362C3|nr:hypothetical protein [Neobacillus sp. 114]MBU8918873.1 hypothetical protein [Bacillus sp. FJAT-29953]